MPATYEPIASQTLGSDTATVTFSDIPGNFTDLVLVCSAFTSVNDRVVYMRFNADTGSNYSKTNIIGYSGGAISQRISNAAQAVIAEGTSDAASDTYVTSIMSYANTNVYKTALSSEASPNRSLVSRVVNLWRSTSAVTSIALSLNSGNFKSGSTFSLYGIKAA